LSSLQFELVALQLGGRLMAGCRVLADGVAASGRHLLRFQLPPAHEILVGLPGVVVGLARAFGEDHLSLSCGLQGYIEVDPRALSLRAPSFGSLDRCRCLITRVQWW
jgi:hypothetical protein